MTDELIQREDTMIYRKPVDDSDPHAVSNIWGKDLETRVVDAAEVGAMLGEGWVRDPRHIDNPPKAEEAAGFAPDRSNAELKAAHERIAALESDLKAATELADAESKAKDEALAKLAAATDAKPAGTLGVKANKPTP